jgi:uncharacterized membrane protein
MKKEENDTISGSLGICENRTKEITEKTRKLITKQKKFSEIFDTMKKDLSLEEMFLIGIYIGRIVEYNEVEMVSQVI